MNIENCLPRARPVGGAELAEQPIRRGPLQPVVHECLPPRVVLRHGQAVAELFVCVLGGLGEGLGGEEGGGAPHVVTVAGACGRERSQ